jgi:hypothetical protein
MKRAKSSGPNDPSFHWTLSEASTTQHTPIRHLPSHNMKADTPANVLTRELAQYLDRADSQGISKKTQAQCFRDTLQRLEKLRPNARPAEIQRIFNVGAWYQLFGWPPKLPSWAEPSDAQVFAGSRIVSALVNLHKDWKRADTLPKVRCPPFVICICYLYPMNGRRPPFVI